MKATPRQIPLGDQNLALIQDSTRQAFGALQKIPFIKGQLLQSKNSSTGAKSTTLPLTAGQANTFQHSLGYAPQFVLPFAPSAQATIWVTATTKTSVTLQTSANCNVQVWVS